MNKPVNKKSGMDVYAEGWLLKKKSNDTAIMFKSHNQRWFRLQEVQVRYLCACLAPIHVSDLTFAQGADHKELALVYYQNQKENEAKGWIYMKDVVRIVEDKKTFSVISPARTMVLEATTAAEHNAWIADLHRACPQLRRADSRESTASSSAAGAKDNAPERSATPSAKGEGQEFSPLSHDALRQLDAKGTGKGPSNQIDRSASLFSRHAQGEKNSFYNAQGKPSVPIAHTESGEENYREEDLIHLQPDLMRSTDSISGLLEREQRQNADRRDRDGHPPRPRTDSRGAAGGHGRDVDDNASEGSGGRRSASHHTQDDHRKHGYRHGGDVTHRLHRHIAKEPPSSSHGGAGRRDDRYDDDAPRHSAQGSRQGSRQSSRENSAQQRQSGRDTRYRDEEDYEEQSRYVYRDDGDDREPPPRRPPRSAEGRPPPADRSPRDDESKRGEGEEDVEDVSLRVRRRPSRQPSRDEDDDRPPAGRERRDSRTAFGDDAAAQAPAPSSSGPSGGLNRSLPKPTKRPPPPTTAPPPRRTARDALALDGDGDADGTAAGNATAAGASSALPRRSIDEILFRQQQSQADEKDSAGGAERRDSSDDEGDVDFKVSAARPSPSHRTPTASHPPVSCLRQSEYLRHAEQKSVSPDASGKPPKHSGASSGPPPASPPVYTLPNHRNPQRAGTPPRPNGNAGPMADRNFATENWDDDDGADSKTREAAGRTTDAKDAATPTALMADPNWLEENFDD